MDDPKNEDDKDFLRKCPKKIAVLTSGGDAPGMNAAVRAIVRTAISNNIEVVGVYQGYDGLIESSFSPLTLRSMANIIQRGGTILKTGRSEEFRKNEARKRATRNLKREKIEALVVIGGDGSLRGAQILNHEYAFRTIGIPGTIDNDVHGSDYSIGFDTAVNTALDAIDRIRDTAASHDRIFIVEVMGRNSGFIAVNVGAAGGAEEIFTPEHYVNMDDTVERIKSGLLKGKKSSILVAAEAHKPGRAYDLAGIIKRKTGYEPKVCILGHIQRGGSPTAKDRIMASQFGHHAVLALMEGKSKGMIGYQNGNFHFVPYEEVFRTRKIVPETLIELTRVLSN